MSVEKKGHVLREREKRKNILREDERITVVLLATVMVHLSIFLQKLSIFLQKLSIFLQWYLELRMEAISGNFDRF